MEDYERERSKVLGFLKRKYTELPDEFFSDNIIARYCKLDEELVEKICISLEKNGFIQNARNQKDPSYKITTDGLILLEKYCSGGTTGGGISVSRLKESVQNSLEKMRIMNSELQAGVVEAGKKHNLRDGLFYVVMADLEGSTFVSSKMNGTTFSKWIKQFIDLTKNALHEKKRNLAIFVKSMGDGSLFLFRNFDDILDWKRKVDEFCNYHNDRCERGGKPDFHQYNHKTIIHLSEVYFDPSNSDLNAFGVNLVFKIEKKFRGGEIGITDAVRQIILQEINAGKFNISSADSYSLDEKGGNGIALWRLTPLEQGF